MVSQDLVFTLVFHKTWVVFVNKHLAASMSTVHDLLTYVYGEPRVSTTY